MGGLNMKKNNIEQKKYNQIPLSKDGAMNFVESETGKAKSDVSDMFKMQAKDKELEDYIKKRDEGLCRVCKKNSEQIAWLEDREGEGLKKPINLYSSCDACAEKKVDEQKIKNQNEHYEEKGVFKVDVRGIEIHHSKETGKVYGLEGHNLAKKISQRLIYDQNEYDYTKKVKKTINEVKVSYHAYERWNDRVGPHVDGKEYIQRLFQKLIEEPERIILISDDFGIVDNDILFTFEMKDGLFFITTFYGRISLHPALSDIHYIKKWQSHSNERLDLKMSDDLLKKQSLPIVSNKYVYFSGKNHEYKIEEYRMENEVRTFLLVVKSVDHRLYVKELDRSQLKSYGKSVKKGVKYLYSI